MAGVLLGDGGKGSIAGGCLWDVLEQTDQTGPGPVYMYITIYVRTYVYMDGWMDVNLHSPAAHEPVCESDSMSWQLVSWRMTATPCVVTGRDRMMTSDESHRRVLLGGRCCYDSRSRHSSARVSFYAKNTLDIED